MLVLPHLLLITLLVRVPLPRTPIWINALTARGVVYTQMRWVQALQCDGCKHRIVWCTAYYSRAASLDINRKNPILVLRISIFCNSSQFFSDFFGNRSIRRKRIVFNLFDRSNFSCRSTQKHFVCYQ